LKGCRCFSTGAEMEGGSKGERRLAEGDREGHDPKLVEAPSKMKKMNEKNIIV